MRPESWPGLRPGPVNRTGRSSPSLSAVEALLLGAQQGQQFLQPGVLDRLGHLVRRAGGRRAGAGRVFEAECLREADPADQVERRLEVRIGLAGVADDEVGRQREIRPGRPQPVDQARGSRPRCACGSSPPAPGPSPTAPADAGTASASARPDAPRSGRRPCRAGARWCSGAAAGPGARPARGSARRSPTCRHPGAAPCQAFTFWPEQRDLARPARDQAPRFGEHGRAPAGCSRRRACRGRRRSEQNLSQPSCTVRNAVTPWGADGRRAGGRTCPRPGNPSRSPRRRPAPRAPPSPAAGDRSAAPARCRHRARGPGSPAPSACATQPATARMVLRPAASRACLITRSRPSSQNTFSSARSRMWQVLRMTMSASSGTGVGAIAQRRQHVGHPPAVVDVHLTAPGDHVQKLRRPAHNEIPIPSLRQAGGCGGAGRWSSGSGRRGVRRHRLKVATSVAYWPVIRVKRKPRAAS